ncbi:MAG: DUF3592 domain-containing protein [bacterium]|nr:DUF3592 domain-containing protein [bacterium]
MFAVVTLLVVAGLAVILRMVALTNMLPERILPAIRIVGLAVALLASVLFVSQSQDVNSAIARRNWPTTSGRIISSEVSGGKLFRPQVIFEFEVDSNTRIDTSHLHAPGFGGKNQRRETAERLLVPYVVGESLTVFYNPDNHDEVTIINTVRWDLYVRPGFSLLLVLAGLVIALPVKKRSG